jgi:hypothetical protein
VVELLNFALLLITALDILDLMLKLVDLPLKLRTLPLKGGYLKLHLLFPLLRLETLSHAIGNRGLVQSLISLYGHAYFIPDPDQQQPPLGAVDGDLPDELVEALGVQFLPKGADAGLPGLLVLQPLVQLLLQVQHVLGGRRGCAH